MNKIKLICFGLSILLTEASPGTSLHYQNPPIIDSLRVIEKVFLHIDRDSYNEGDDIWFRAYLVDALDHMLTDHSTNLHVELISASSKIISGKVIRLEGGLGNGDFKLPSDIKQGRYKIRAYTNYMRNFGDQSFFNKEIYIANSTNSDKIPDEVYVDKKISVSFFPEGGSLVENVSSVVAFKAIDNVGKGSDVSGKIYSSAGDLITTFKSTHMGMGSFFLRPLPGLKYYSIFKGSDSIDIRAELPASFPIGVTFAISMNPDNELIITTKTNPQTLAIIQNHELLLSISLRKDVFKKIPCRINSPVTSFVVPTDDLPDGILMLTLTSMEDLPLAERLVFIEREAPGKIKIEIDKLLYSKREPVSLKISLGGDSTSESEGNISLAVVNKNLLDNTSRFPGTISSWFLLESDIRGYVEDPSYYFDPSNPDRLKDLDLLLLTQGWRDFSWKYNTTYFPPEKGFSISGILRKNNKNKLIKDSRVSIGIFGSLSTLVTTIPVDSTGRFDLHEIDFSGDARLIVSGIDQKDQLKGILTLDSLLYNPAKVPDSLSLVPILTEKNNSRLKSYYIINESIRKKYKLTDTISIGEVNIIAEKPKDLQTGKIERSRAKYGTPEGELIITDQMLGYLSLIDLFKGRFPGVEVVMPGNIIRIRGASSIGIDSTGKGSGILPLVLIDGNPVPYEEIYNIPVNFIDRIDILKSVVATSIFGMNAANGVINLITRSGGISNRFVPVDYSVNIRISGYDIPRIFYSPQHLTDSNSDYNPDLRSTLFWKPDIKLEGNKESIVKYYNGDNLSPVRVTAEGITSSGIPVTGMAEYEVR
jgi:hypothetical protein